MSLLTPPSTDFILFELREPLQQTRMQSSMIDHSISDYVLLILTPTLVLHLIMEDMSLEVVEAHRVMTESVRMGEFFN